MYRNYGKRQSYPTKRKSLTAARPQSSSSNKTVRKVYRKPAAPNKMALNKTAIMALSKQVKSLQLGRHGYKQWQHQFIASTDNLGHTTMTAMQHTPLAFMANNFFSGGIPSNSCYVYTGGVTAGVPTLSHAHRWDKVVSEANLNDEFNFNLKQNSDTLNHTQYLPVSANYKFQITCDSAPTLTPVQFRIQVFKFKNAVEVGHFKTTLPYNLGAYSHMCDRNPLTRNTLNTHEYHVPIIDKMVSFPQTDVLRSQVTKYINFKLWFPNKAIVYDKFTTDEELHKIIPTKDQYWVLLSSDTVQPRCLVSAERWLVWRDNAGVGS